MMLAGTVQKGLKLISVTLLLTIGDGRSTLPTIAVWRDATTPFSTASTCAAGMFTMMKRSGSFCVLILSRVRLVESWLSRTAAGNVERREGRIADHAVDRDAVPRLEALHRRLDIGVEGLGDAERHSRDRRR